MPLSQPITSGAVHWTGDNPGILLRNEDGSPSASALFFRVAWSPVGQGHLLLLYGRAGEARGSIEAPNVLLSDNPALTDFLMANFIGKLPTFRDAPAFKQLVRLPIGNLRSFGDPMGHRYGETIACDGLVVELVWEGLEEPRALELTPDQVGTGEHLMFSLLIPARSAQIIVNGRSLPGKVGTRVQAGFETTTAFLYFSETWITPPG